MKQELGLNAFGERVYIDDAGDLKVVKRATASVRNKKPPVDLAALRETIGAITERVKALCAPTLANEVETEIAKYPGVAAIVNEATGKVATFLVPKPYSSLTPKQRTALETERDRLITSLPTLGRS